MKKVFLENLPVKGQRINWKESIGYKVKFIYEDIQGEIEIVNYESKGQILFIKYKNCDNFKIYLSNFLKCKFGNILNKKTNKFKFNIGDKINNIIIIDKQYKKRNRNNGYIENQKYYKYHCNKCGYEGWLEENKINRGDECACCSNHVAVLGINTIWDTDKWMCDLGISEEDAKKYCKKSGKRIKVICPQCEREKTMKISDIYNNHSIGCICGDGFSYPEKFIYGILNELNINFQIQLNKTTFEWCKRYRYDFYIPSINAIIEAHGLQHYSENTFIFCGGKNIEEIQNSDRLKKELALKNGIKEENYIIIDCRYSELEWIKNNILNSNLAKLFDLSKIDWLQCHEYACSNLVKKACELRKNNSDLTTTEIGKIMKIHPKTIIQYLKAGNQLGWCEYNSKEEMKKCAIKRQSKSVKLFKNNIFLGEFKSYKELEEASKELLGEKLFTCYISSALLKSKEYKGYTFK